MRNVGVVASRILAVFLGVEALITIISYLIAVRGFYGTVYFWAAVLTQLGAAVLLWVFAGPIGNAIAGGTSPSEGPRQSLMNLHVLGLSLIGVWLVAHAIPALIETLAVGSGRDNFGILRPGPFANTRGATIVGELIRAAVGLALIFGSSSMAAALTRRGMGPAAENEAP